MKRTLACMALALAVTACAAETESGREPVCESACGGVACGDGCFSCDPERGCVEVSTARWNESRWGEATWHR